MCYKQMSDSICFTIDYSPHCDMNVLAFGACHMLSYIFIDIRSGTWLHQAITLPNTVLLPLRST